VKEGNTVNDEKTAMKKKIKLRVVDGADLFVARNKGGSLETHKWVWCMNHITTNNRRQLPDRADCLLRGLLLMAKGLRLVLRITLVERIVSS
jgi:hypothetical protein